MKVVLSHNAEEDLEAIGRAPKAYPFADRQGDSALRRRIYRNYLIFFDVGATEVEILHVLHGARDSEQIIFPEEPA
ncbi:MAG: type II toxin-antitoxin system RelE/ParE family toxin [Alphaproteobacteria bacterium]|nr:type II toxin-antitoxin system RelE/ParE family toxin [Alphaproteobacteria bacterium]